MAGSISMNSMDEPGTRATAPGASPGQSMDRIYRHQRHIYDLTRKYYLLGRDELIRALQPPAGGSVLEVGCGTGRNLIAAAKLYPNTRFFGFDISAEMLRTARINVQKAGLADRIRFARADASGFDGAASFGVPEFDRIFISYALSMIPPWEAALSQALSHLARGGQLHIVDFGQLERLPPVCRALLFAWLGRFHVTPRADLPGRLHDMASAPEMVGEFRPLLRGYAWSGILSRLRADHAV